MTPSGPVNSGPAQRRRHLLLHGFQLRYVLLVAGSLIVMLLFTGFHGLFVVKLILPADISEQVRPVFESSTWRIFLVGMCYIGVVSLGAVFLSNRAVGPLGRLEKEIKELKSLSVDERKLKIREGDEISGIAEAINELIHHNKGSKVI